MQALGRQWARCGAGIGPGNVVAPELVAAVAGQLVVVVWSSTPSPTICSPRA